MKKKHLVTGGTGFIGRALVEHLVLAGHSVRILDNGLRGNSTFLGDLQKEVELLPADIRDASAVSKAVKGCHTVWHLAAVNGTENFYKKPELVLEVGVKGIVNVIDACREHHVDDLFVMSSSEVYQTPPRIPTDERVPLVIPDPMNPRFSYAASKMISEMMALHCGKDVASRIIIVRPHNVYGPAMGWEHVVPQLIARMLQISKPNQGPIKMPIQGSGNETRAFCYVTDMAKALLLLYEKGVDREIYHVGNPIETPIRSLVMEIAKSFRVQVEVEPGELTQGSTERRCPSVEKISQLGFRPLTSLAEGIQKTAEWYAKELLRIQERKAA